MKSENITELQIIEYIESHGIITPDANTDNSNQEGNYLIHSYKVDILIAPLVDALNSTGYAETKASCHGHWRKNQILLVPYVAFTATMGFAEALDFALRPTTQNKGFYFYWEIDARFNNDRQLMYNLRPPHGQFNLEIDLLWWWQRKKWWKRFRDKELSDIKNMTTLVEGVAKKRLCQ